MQLSAWQFVSHAQAVGASRSGEDHEIDNEVAIDRSKEPAAVAVAQVWLPHHENGHVANFDAVEPFAAPVQRDLVPPAGFVSLPNFGPFQPPSNLAGKPSRP